MTRSNLTTILRALWRTALSLTLATTAWSCSPVFEDEDDCCEPKCELYLQLHFDPEEPLNMRMVASRATDPSSFFDPEIELRRAVTDDGTDIYHLTDVKRYIIKAYPLDEEGHVNTAEFDYFRIIASSYGFDGYVTQKLLLSYKPYRIYVWADYGDDDANDLYYNTSSFSAISFHGEYSGSNYNRVAYVGTTDVDLSGYAANGATSANASIEMDTPMARILFLTTDLQQFFAEMVERKASRQSSYEVTDTEGYKLRIRYTGYIPSVYDMFYGRPVDSAVGISFWSSITKYTETTALLGFDYILVNGEKSAVDVIIDVYELDDDGNPGEYLGSTPSMSVPIAKGQFTAVYGEFLTTTGKGDIGIDPGFDDEIYIHWE